MMQRKCDNCGELVKRSKIKKVNDKFYCSKCYKELKKNHRKETIEVTGIKEDLRILKNKIAREKGYSKKAYTKKVIKEKGYTPIEYKLPKESKPLPKRYINFEKSTKKNSLSSYISLEEKKILLKELINRGLTFEEAKERVNLLQREQTRVRNQLREQGKKEEQINIELKIKQDKMLEELWNY